MPRTADLAWDEAGSGPAVLLLHSGITDRHMWDPQMAPLAEQYRVIRFDARGFGESGPTTSPYHPYDDAATILDAAGVDAATVVGSSMGGLAAIDLAIARPERVSALVAVGIGPGGRTPDAQLRAGWDAVGAAVEAGDIERAIDLDVEMWVRDPAIVPLVRAWNAAIFARGEDDDHELELEPPAVGRLGEIRCPVLAVVGDHDQPFMVEGARVLAEGVADGRLVVMPGLMHLPSLESPAEFTRILLDFLGAG
jgi:pimeloyl-ACP methyl ester carboxylesterase